MANLKFTPRKHLQGKIDLPADKSILHRALIVNAIAKGEAVITAHHIGVDNQTTINALRALGVEISVKNNEIHIQGVGMHGLKAASEPIDCGNSGTTMRLLAGLLCAQKFSSELTGDASLLQRPMQRIIDPLTKMGAKITSKNTCAPLKIEPGKLQPLHYEMPVASAQVKSALLLAGLASGQAVTLSEPHESRDHTERLLQVMGKPPIATDIQVPGDFSAAAFFITAACLAERADVSIPAVNVNPTRTGLLRYLVLMGVPVKMSNQRWCAHEPVADIHIKTVKRLNAVTVRAEHIANMIDELPLLFLLAAKAQGTTIVPNVSELRVKECDRLQAMVSYLQMMGVAVELDDDKISIIGSGKLQGGEFDCLQDHRMAMTLAVASVATQTAVLIKQADCYAISFPNFLHVCRSLSMQHSLN